MLIPAPNLTLLPVSIAVREFSPWLAAMSLLFCGMALRFHKRLAPLLLGSTLVLAWPLAEIPGIERRMAAQLSQPAPFRVSGFFRSLATTGAQPETLPLRILYYRPRGEGLHPGLIDIYGGAWQRGSPEDNQRFDRYMASQGYAVFAIDYRHAPAARFPAQIEDVRAAILFVHSHAIPYGADPNRLALSGRSSGGQLALLAAYEGGPVRIGAVIGIYSPTDLVRGYADLPSPDPLHVRKVLETYLGGTPSEAPDAYRAASPVMYANRPLPPTLLVQGGRDHIVKPEFARELQRRLLASGNRAVLLEVPWAEHAFDAAFAGLGNRLALDYIGQFLDEALRAR